MLKSMTGFGRSEILTDEYKLSVEMKAVNHRYLDLNIKMPKKFNYFEAAIRSTLKQYIQRGKVDVFITYEDYTEDTMVLRYNASLAAEYMKYFKQMEEEFGIVNDIKVSALSKCPEVLTMEPVVEDEGAFRSCQGFCGSESKRRREPERRFTLQTGLYGSSCR